MKSLCNAVRHTSLAAQTVVELLANRDVIVRDQVVSFVVRVLESSENGTEFGRVLLENGFWQAMHRRSLSGFHPFQR